MMLEILSGKILSFSLNDFFFLNPAAQLDSLKKIRDIYSSFGIL